jgi:hypothetical protein
MVSVSLAPLALFAMLAETLFDFEKLSIRKITIIGAMNPYAWQAILTFHQRQP